MKARGTNMENTFGERIQSLRKKRNWTQEEVANKLKVTAQAVSKWEKDVSLPDVQLLSSIAQLFNTSIDYLLGNAQGTIVEVTSKEKKDFKKLVFKVLIRSVDGDKVKINLPMALVMLALETGMTPKIDGRDVLKGIDIKAIVDLVEQGVIGRIVEIESNEGDIVEIIVE
jgi:transcriptional regulator with XRE-family HTH domain